MIKVLIIDDEPKNSRILNGLLEEFCPQVQVVGEAVSAETGIPLIHEKEPDLVLLDIEMPYGNAFDLLDQVMPVNFEVIFITAFDDYTLKAFKYSALDYLLKPVSIDELKAAIQRAEEKIQNKNINQQLNNLLENIRKTQPILQKIAFQNKDDLVFVALSDIIRFEARDGYTYAFTHDQRKFLSAKTIKEYEEILPDGKFFRVHNSHIINLDYVMKYHKGRGGMIEMKDKTMVEVAIRRRDEFLARFG